MKTLKTKIKLASNANPKWNSSSSSTFLNLKDYGKLTSLLLLLLTDYETRQATYSLLSRIRCLIKDNGNTWATMYLKEAHRLTMKALAGQPESSTMRVSSRRGLPLIIPGVLRIRIERGDIPVTRAVLTALTIYRILKCKPQLKLSTITDPFKGIMTTLPMPELLQAIRPLDYRTVSLPRNARILHSVKAGPNSPISVMGSILDAYAFKNHYPHLIKELEIVCQSTGTALFDLFKKDVEHLSSWLITLHINRYGAGKIFQAKLPDLKLGKLSKKFEPAGKVRIFAITDIWTQSALKPLNDYLFNILKKIPQDGTFDQMAPLMALKEKGIQSLYSFDLSAATDRLPMDLQVQVMSILRGETFANAWRNLLVDRDWFLDKVPYRYSVGQPMGALSSWASLALTHHIIVQVAARRANWDSWFDSYAILGDDIVIANKEVASNYLSIMKSLGVDINLSKSLESHIGLAEFAKRLVGNQGDISPCPPKLLLRTALNPLYLTNTLRDLFGRGGLKRPLDLKRFVDSISRTRKLPKNFIWNISGPLGFLDLLGLSPFLGKRSLSEDQLRSVAKAVDEVVNARLVRNFYRSIEEAQKYWTILTNELMKPTSLQLGYQLGWFQTALLDSSESMKSVLRRRGWSKNDYIFSDVPSVIRVVSEQDRILSKLCSSSPSLIDYRVSLEPLGLTYDTLYNYMVESLALVDGVKSGVPNILEKSIEKDSFSNRLVLYRELEKALENAGMATVLKIRSLPDLSLISETEGSNGESHPEREVSSNEDSH